MKGLCSLVVALTLVFGFLPLTCTAHAVAHEAESCGCCGSEPAPDSGASDAEHCACVISACDKLNAEPLELYAATAPLPLLGSVPGVSGRVPAVVCSGEVFFTGRRPEAPVGPSMIDQIRCVRLLL
ncbi:hypothetical protein H5P28_18135 [Ruficoccus amylovorans]|uniref:Secreted protein n=1 Tax=Ruficoccus amylovorans TaxID=1804625 RepID=A0A842HIF4_9BACT|nr:hypothetical protein [Ruficoccus amylovorans]MBC2596192.1 hypothetical protein [Ruficoccus amylovorans]